MSTDKKRKSGDAVVPAAKKVKTAAPAKSADRPAPLKSALKKSKVEETVAQKPTQKKEKKQKAEVAVVEQPKQKTSKAESTVVEQPKEKKSKTSKKPVVEELAQEADQDEAEAEDGAELTADQTAALLAGFSSDEDEDAEEGEDGIALDKLPAAPVQKKSSKAATTEDDLESTPGVIFVSRVPHGFFEAQMRAYFSQFGTITHLRLARNRKTGKSKHFAFIEFASASVADIVVKTMDKYLLFGHILQVRRVPQEQVKEGIWKGPKGKVAPKNRLEGAKLRRGADREAWQKRITREEGRRREKAKKLAEMGYEFDMPAVKTVDAVPVKQDTAIEEPEGVQLIEGKKAETEPGVEEKIEIVVEKGKVTIEKERKVKRKSKDAAPAATGDVTKKRKTKA